MKKIISVLLLLLVIITSCTSLGFIPAQYRISDFQLQSLRTNEIPIAIFNYETSNPNTAGGIDAYVRFQNVSERTIKYVRFTVTPFNRVDDVAFSTIGNRSTTVLRDTGPYAPGERVTNSYFRNVWYNPTISRFEINSIEVIFMDDSSKIFDQSQIAQMMVR